MPKQCPPFPSPGVSGKRRGSVGAFSLVELTIAMGLMSFCLVALMGMMPVALMQEKKSQEKQSAGLALTAIASDVKSKLSNGRTPRYEIAIPAVGGSVSEGKIYLNEEMEMAANEKQRRFEVVYKITPPKLPYGSYHISASIGAYLSSNTGNRTDLDRVDVVLSRNTL